MISNPTRNPVITPAVDGPTVDKRGPAEFDHAMAYVNKIKESPTKPHYDAANYSLGPLSSKRRTAGPS